MNESTDTNDNFIESDMNKGVPILLKYCNDDNGTIYIIARI